MLQFFLVDCVVVVCVTGPLLWVLTTVVLLVDALSMEILCLVLLCLSVTLACKNDYVLLFLRLLAIKVLFDQIKSKPLPTFHH